MKAIFLKCIFLCFALSSFNSILAQTGIKFQGFKINNLDRQKRKQGEWIFFDNKGSIQLSTFYKDDVSISPFIFYENRDTAFVKFPIDKNREDFIYYNKGNKYFGTFIHTSDTTSLIELDADTGLAAEVLQAIKRYRDFILEPVYFFAQKKLIDILAAGFTTSNFVFNKSIYAMLSISGSGAVTRVDFPADKNNLSAAEETELYQIYSNMQTWQPLFWKNHTRSAKLMLGNGATLSYGF